jgi:hypothetical protein
VALSLINYFNEHPQRIIERTIFFLPFLWVIKFYINKIRYPDDILNKNISNENILDENILKIDISNENISNINISKVRLG